MSRPIIALQMYTLRDITGTDMAGAMREVAAMGYEGIELAGYGDLTAQQVKDLATELNLKVISNHTSLDALRGDLKDIVATKELFGYDYVACSYMAENERPDGAAYKLRAAELEAAGRKLQASGLQLCYHNHDFEFMQFDGEYGLDILYGNSDPSYLKGEIDTYWVQRGGADPAEYIRKWAGRAPLIHIKDMSGDGTEAFAEVGAGILDWPAIFEASEAGGAVAYIVEQDTCPGNPLDSVRLSIENLKKMGKLG